MKVHMPLLERAHSRESCGLQFESRPVLFRALKSQGRVEKRVRRVFWLFWPALARLMDSGSQLARRRGS